MEYCHDRAENTNATPDLEKSQQIKGETYIQPSGARSTSRRTPGDSAAALATAQRSKKGAGLHQIIVDHLLALALTVVVVELLLGQPLVGHDHVLLPIDGPRHLHVALS
eukprot:1874898-Pyramimonas_sp.AAC.1